MYRALYRKWRPRDFDEVCGQDGVTNILRYQIKEGRVSHAYLFCGSRGTGKTTCAKILAKAVNCEAPVNGNPCHECPACQLIDSGTAVDVIEMDAASNNGVDNVRDMKDEISFNPAQLSWRVYIIDEVHMMSAGAFNALLKTLEEPPARVMFILATTELQKLPATIVSRCQRFDFKRITTPVLMDRLLYIAGEEEIPLTEDGAREIARMAEGGMRDAISLLELCASSGENIDADCVVRLLGGGNRERVFDLADALVRKDYAALYRSVEETVMGSGDVGLLWKQFGEVCRDLLVISVLDSAQTYLDLTDHEYARLRDIAQRFTPSALMWMSHVQEETALSLQKPGVSKRAAVELALTRMCDPGLSVDPEALLLRVEALESEVKRLRAERLVAPPPTADKPEREEKKTAAPAPRSDANDSAAPAASTGRASGDPTPPARRPIRRWRDVLTSFSTVKPSFATVLQTADAFLDDSGALCISVRHDFMTDLLRGDDQTLRLILSLVCDVEPACDAARGVRFIDPSPASGDAPFSF
ncbi:MAG: DNA polymerase III subunit gamma/tau [Clostridia bacterium]|nr:DNA polymerase III subunit gamma/tau [Clostridia bacterium]